MALVPMEFDDAGFEEVSFSSIFNTSYKSSFVSSVEGAAFKMKDSNFYFVQIKFVTTQGNAWAVLGRFNITFNPRIIVPMISNSRSTVDGTFWSANPSSNTEAYNFSQADTYFVSFVGFAT